MQNWSQWIEKYRLGGDGENLPSHEDHLNHFTPIQCQMHTICMKMLRSFQYHGNKSHAILKLATMAMFTLYRTVKRSVAESVPDRASVHTRNAAFEAVSAPEQYCSAPLLKVERSVSDRFLRRSESSLNTFIGAEIATEPRIGKLSFQIKRERCKLHNG